MSYTTRRALAVALAISVIYWLGAGQIVDVAKPVRLHENSFQASDTQQGMKLLIVILTGSRDKSLLRLLSSLSAANYEDHCIVDLQINVDMPRGLTSNSANACVLVATGFRWSHGRKTVFRRLAPAGLSQSWFEVPFDSQDYEYLSILEDDMQVSPHFLDFFSLVDRQGALRNAAITGFCLHPGDWEVYVPRTCTSELFSKILYESPEPCNWGPIWKYSEWRKFISWVFEMKSTGELPIVSEEISYNFNKYVETGMDVQSSWVWRYNHENARKQIRYSFSKCLQQEEVFLSINHKEPGEHFKAKVELNNTPSLLYFDTGNVFRLLEEEAHTPFKFSKYMTNAKSLRGQ